MNSIICIKTGIHRWHLLIFDMFTFLEAWKDPMICLTSQLNPPPQPTWKFHSLLSRDAGLTVEKQAMERNAISKIASSSDANDERHRRCTNGLGKFISKLSQLHYTLQFIWWSFSTWCICFVNWQYWQYWQYVEKERDNSTWKFPKFIEHWRLGKSHLNQTSSNIHGWIHLNLIVGVC